MKLTIAYLMPVLVILIFIMGFLVSCDKVTPDIRKEQINDNLKPDYFGIRWDWKW